MSDDKNGKEPENSEENNNGPSLQNKLIWLVIITIPLFFWLMSNDASSKDEGFPQSLFLEYVAKDQVLEAEIRPEKGFTTYFIVNFTLKPGVIEPEGRKAIKGKQLNYNVTVVDVSGVRKTLDDNGVNYTVKKPQEETMKEVIGMLLPLLVIVFIIYFLFSRQLRSAGKGAMQFGKSRAKLMTASSEKVTFADVAGIEEARSEVEEIVDFLREPDKYRNLGGRLPKGCLMVGPPGTGKTLLARAIAGEAEVPFYSMSGSDFVEMFVGVGASRVRDMFDQAKKNQPCILFIDEIDAVGRARFSGVGGGGGGGGHDEREQTLNALLVEMDGFENQHGVIILAATNRADVLDPALLRPGRFDRRIVVDLPDLEGRLQILNVHGRKVKMAAAVDMKAVAKGTPGFSGADLANVINEAALLAAGGGKKAIDTDDLEEARDKVRWGKERKSRKMSEKELRKTAYHEAGHTLVGLYCEHSMPLHKVTIMPRGNAYLGATMYLPNDDKYTQTRSELIDTITVTMGGRLAEEIEFGEITNGAASDIKHATQVARHMIRDWGMSDEMSFIQYSHDESKGGYQFQNEYSVETGNKLDEEVRKLIDGQFARAKKILLDHRDQLTLLSETLLKKETMSAYEVKTLLGFEVDENDFLTTDESAKKLKDKSEEKGSSEPEEAIAEVSKDKSEGRVVESSKGKKEEPERVEVSKGKDISKES